MCEKNGDCKQRRTSTLGCKIHERAMHSIPIQMPIPLPCNRAHPYLDAHCSKSNKRPPTVYLDANPNVSNSASCPHLCSRRFSAFGRVVGRRQGHKPPAPQMDALSFPLCGLLQLSQMKGGRICTSLKRDALFCNT